MSTGNPIQRKGFLTREWLPIRHWKPAALLLAGLGLWLFGHGLLPMALHVLHLVLGILEVAALTVAVEVFGLSHDTAHVVIAYTGLALALYFGGKLSYRAYLLTMRTLARCRQWAIRLSRSRPVQWMENHWRLLVLGGGVITLTWLVLL